MSNRGMRRAVLALLLWWPATAAADPLATDLTRHLIAITTGFTGASVVLFGATDGDGDIIVTVRGPEREMTVRRKERLAGVWVNAEAMTFAAVPSFYFVAANRPLGDVLDPQAAAANRLGLANLRLEAELEAPPELIAAFADALVKAQQRRQRFQPMTAKVHFLGERLFRTTIEFPANVPTGTYLVDTLLVRDKQIVAIRRLPLVISKIGLGAAVFDFASHQPALYGAIAVVIAMVAGWAASLPFRGT